MQKLDDSSFRNELIELIYGSLLEHGKWKQFLDQLNGMMRHAKTTFMYYDSVVRQGYFSLTSGYTDDEVAAYNAHYNTINPWMPKAAVRRVGVGVTSDHMFDADLLRRTEFYNDYLLKGGLEGGAGLTVFRDKGRSFVLTTLMSAKDHQSSAKLADLFTELSPHLARAFSYHRSSAKDSDGSRAQCQLLDAAGIGLVIVDEDGRVRMLNGTAESLIDQDCGLRLAPNRAVVFATGSLQDMLKGMCRRYSTDRVRRSELGLHEKRLEITMVRMQSDTLREFLMGPSVAVLMKPLALGDSLSRYALSSRETEVAKAIIAGKSIRQIADERSLSRETVRTQLKSVFAKLGVASQLELVRKFRGH
ncbi:DNA-binding CsgD family transcriptional regulator (plasmid) [Ensifer sp. WSM1721]|uniref:helix-turn-helix transcriptional regulator n=1 Tax=Ensifer sp. WSM1721 TaxID=1041159 RepID=UPI0018DD49F1|nr:helix-turn-helix transcriptional regulator [Ensifer sp. WSM1721]